MQLAFADVPNRILSQGFGQIALDAGSHWSWKLEAFGLIDSCVVWDIA